MPSNLRKLGVHGTNLPAKKSLTVTASPFSIGGMIGKTERAYNRTYPVKSINEFREIFGEHISSSHYLSDAVKGFFENTRGVDATLYIQSYVGYTAGAIDAVAAYREKIDDGSDADAYVVTAGYLDETEYGVSGNRTGTKFTQTDRITTAAAGTCPATGQSYAQLDSVVNIKVGDLICFKTNGGVDLVYKIVTQIDESTNYVYWTGNFEVSGGSAETLAIDDVVTIPGFRIQTYRKTISGVEYEVDKELGKVICSTESAVTDFYVENVFKSSKWIKVNEQSASTLGDRLPTDDSSVVYCTSGADGTTIATAAILTVFLQNFDDDPIRFLALPETTTESFQKALITYSNTRDDDNPICIINIPEDQTKAELLVIGNSYQTSVFTPALIVANWLGVDDPFSTSSIAPSRHVPNVGHVMGAWIWTIETLGIHYVPATQNTVLAGVNEVIGDTFLDDDDRTDLAENGINIIRDIDGIGIKIADYFTLSTDVAYQFGNIILMRNYIKVSVIDSLAPTENTPNTLVRISTNKSKIEQFLINLWNRGSTGNVPTGETFGQQIINDVPSGVFDHIEVKADSINNTNTTLALGQQNYDIYFSAPPPAGSILIGVGILIK